MPSSSDAAPAGHRPRASAIRAFLEGWRRVFRAPMLTGGAVVLTVLTVLPLATVLDSSVLEDVGSGLEAERSLSGWRADWASAFTSGALGMGRTFAPEMLGFGATLFMSGDAESIGASATGALAAYVALWIFLSGGVLDRLARGQPVRISAFFSTCGAFFVRFLRLAVAVGVCYWALFRWLHPLLFERVSDLRTSDAAGEVGGTVLLLQAILYLVFLGALMVVSAITGFAMVRAVVEDRRSMIGAIVAATRFVRRRTWRILSLYLLNLLALLIMTLIWVEMAPRAQAPVWLVLVAAHVFIVARLWAKLAFMGSEVAFFQGDLAHAGLGPVADPIWPDSPPADVARHASHVER